MNIAVNSLHRVESIKRLEDELSTLPVSERCNPGVEHCFAPGAYARTMLIPKGSLIVGKMHKHSHLNIISFGDVCVATYEGVKHYIGHNVLTSPVGVKRVVYTNEDTMWTTIHLTSETDLEKIEDDVIVDSDDTEFLEEMSILLGGKV